jgi:hypothetical protein
MKIKQQLLAVSAVLSLSYASSSAAVLAGWDFSSITNYGASPYSSATTAANTTNGGIVRGSGIATSGTPAAAAWGGTGFSATTAATALTANELITMAITATPGFQLSLSDIGAYNVSRSPTGPTTGQWQFQLGAGSFTDIGTPITWGAITTSAGNAQAGIVLSGIPSLQNIASANTVTLRLLTWGATAAAGKFYLNDPLVTTANDFTINGKVGAVPEPQLITLLGSLGLVSLLRRRRH